MTAGGVLADEWLALSVLEIEDLVLTAIDLERDIAASDGRDFHHVRFLLFYSVSDWYPGLTQQLDLHGDVAEVLHENEEISLKLHVLTEGSGPDTVAHRRRHLH